MQTITLWWRHEFIAIAAAALCIACLALYIDSFTMNAEQKTLLHIEKIEQKKKDIKPGHPLRIIEKQTQIAAAENRQKMIKKETKKKQKTSNIVGRKMLSKSRGSNESKFAKRNTKHQRRRFLLHIHPLHNHYRQSLAWHKDTTKNSADPTI